MNRKITPYLFLTPFLAVFIVFIVYPILDSLYLSFQSVQGTRVTFVGLQNYINVLTDGVFWKSLFNVFIFFIFQVPIMLILATIFASILNTQTLRFKSVFRLFIFFPVLIDLVTYSIIFALLFSKFGMVNYLISLVGLKPIAWFESSFWARILIIIAITWRWTGYNTIILLAGLQSVSNDLYEVADIEGATSLQKLFKITLPIIKPVLLFCAIISTIGTIQLFAEAQVLTNGGGPNNSTLTPILYLYEYGFQSFKFGYASAVAYVITTIVFIMSYIQIKITKGGRV